MGMSYRTSAGINLMPTPGSERDKEQNPHVLFFRNVLALRHHSLKCEEQLCSEQAKKKKSDFSFQQVSAQLSDSTWSGSRKEPGLEDGYMTQSLKKWWFMQRSVVICTMIHHWNPRDGIGRVNKSSIRRWRGHREPVIQWKMVDHRGKEWILNLFVY